MKQVGNQSNIILPYFSENYHLGLADQIATWPMKDKSSARVRMQNYIPLYAWQFTFPNTCYSTSLTHLQILIKQTVDIDFIKLVIPHPFLLAGVLSSLLHMNLASALRFSTPQPMLIAYPSAGTNKIRQVRQAWDHKIDELPGQSMNIHV